MTGETLCNITNNWMLVINLDNYFKIHIPYLLEQFVTTSKTKKNGE